MNPFAPMSAPKLLSSPASSRAGHKPRHAIAVAAISALLTSLVLVAGCGGGGGDAGVAQPNAAAPTATAAAFTQGTINGFGSVIVNGVRFDDSAATVTDDDGKRQTSSALRLGMRVDVDSDKVDTGTASARASALRFGGQVTGPVSAVDPGAGTLSVLGQGVDITATTVFDDRLVGGLTALASGAVVEVHGLADAVTGHIVATRVEPAPAATVYKLRGTVAALDTSAKTFAVGGASISYAGLNAAALPAALANGMVLRVVLATTPVAGQWLAQSLGVKLPKPVEQSAAHLRGAITAFSSSAAFSVDGLAVDASQAVFPDGSAGLALGVQVDVLGQVSNSVLVASRVSLEARHAGDDDRKLELHGAITAVDPVAKTFVLRGVTVIFAGSVAFLGGSEAGLVVGAKVAVKGGVGSSRTQLAALTISFES